MDSGEPYNYNEEYIQTFFTLTPSEKEHYEFLLSIQITLLYPHAILDYGLVSLIHEFLKETVRENPINWKNRQRITVQTVQKKEEKIPLNMKRCSPNT